MRRLLIVLLALLLAATFASARDFEEYETSIKGFAEGVANSLPLNSSIGLTWSDAYIGQFPHLGVGATVGFSSVPYAAVQPVISALGLESQLTSSEAFSYIEQYGAPFPAYAVDARIGGFILPFDVGVKLGTIPPDVDTTSLVDGVDFDYFLAGANVRVPLTEGKGLMPEISVGGGYNYLRASIGLSGLADGDIELTDFSDPRPDVDDTYTLTLTDPEVEYFWSANVIDLQVQASKKILLFTPYLGAAASIGLGQAGGGLYSELESDIEPDDYDAINQAAEAQGLDTLPELGENGFSVTADMPAGWSFRAFGGFSINLLIVKVDITGMYDFLGNNFGVTLGTRVQL
ncbi:MAG: hypothetical protein ACOCXN_11750 [Spirochaetota bacterium]